MILLIILSVISILVIGGLYLLKIVYEKYFNKEKKDVLFSGTIFPVKNIRSIFSISKENLFIAYLRIEQINTTFLDDKELSIKINSLTRAMSEVREFEAFVIPSTFSNKNYFDYIEEDYFNENDPLRKKFKKMRVDDLKEKIFNSISGHEIYFMFKEKITSKEKEKAFYQFILKISQNINESGLNNQILNDQEITLLFNRFSHLNLNNEGVNSKIEDYSPITSVN